MSEIKITHYAIIACCTLMLAVHIWMLFFHRHKMGGEKSDRPQDRWFSHVRLLITFSLTTFYQTGCALRRILIEINEWEKLPIVFRIPFDFLPLPTTSSLFFIGLFIFIFGAGLRRWAMRILGRLFTFEIGIRQGHSIIEEGPYRWIRHPSYTGYILMLLGSSLAFASGAHLIFITFSSFIFFALRIQNEEKMLISHFGKSYEEYMKRTKRLIPKLF